MDEHNQKKAVRLIDYLLRITSLQTKLVRNVDEYEKILWLSGIPRQKGCFTQSWGRDEEYDPDIWVEIQIRREPELPTVPESCKNWFDKSALRKKTDLPELFSQRLRQERNPEWEEGSDQPEFISIIDNISDYPQITEQWNQYLESKWLPWVDEHNSWDCVFKIYSALFTIYQEQLRLGEEYELVLGLGLLTWLTPNHQHIRRHLLVANSILEFEARLGKFTVRPHTDGSNLRPELDMLTIEEQPIRAEESARQALAAAGDDPWERSIIEGILQALVHSIDPRGEFISSLVTDNNCPTEKPIVELAPALILRRRSSKGLTQSLSAIRDKILGGEEVPSEFSDIAEMNEIDKESAIYIKEDHSTLPEEDIFFPKLSNDEQIRIVSMIKSSNGVLVQGPPGTGKSHTIANLICHLLATGQRTLVTAKTPRALQVLEKLIPEDLKPLCINLLGAGLEEKRSLEKSVGGILQKSEHWYALYSKKEISDLENKLSNLREERIRVNRQLRTIRESETHSHSIANGSYSGTAARIAETVAKEYETFKWFRDNVTPFEACPVSKFELLDSLVALRRYTREKRYELGLAWPDDLPSSAKFAEFVENERLAIEEEVFLKDGVDATIANALTRCDSEIIKSLRDGITRLITLKTKLSVFPHPWIGHAVTDLMGGQSVTWRQLAQATKDIFSRIELIVPLADTISLQVPKDFISKDLYQDVCKLKDFFLEGGKLGWGPFRPKLLKPLIYIFKTVRINGRSCKKAKDADLLSNLLLVRLELENLWALWAGHFSKTEGSFQSQFAFFKIQHSILDTACALEDEIEKCHDLLHRSSGIKEPEWTNTKNLENLLAVCRLALALQSRSKASRVLQEIEVTINKIEKCENSHAITKQLKQNVLDRDVVNYENALEEMQRLNEDRENLKTIDILISNLRNKLPLLVDELLETPEAEYWENRIGLIDKSWHWAQARYWIEEYIKREDIPSLTKRASQIDDEVLAIMSKLASLRAWSFCFSRLTEKHRRNMESWQQSMRRLGKGTGKHAHRHRREAQNHLNECHDAVPAWVMPLHRIWDTVAPAPGMFDVIIIDEASQCGLEGLPLFYLGKKVLIVGDDKQISPEEGFVDKNVVFQLMEQYLFDFEQKDSFHRGSSLFSHGKIRYGSRKITLCEHFRCMPEIIRFSNDLCYSDTRLIPLRQYGPERLDPIQHIFVSDGYREGTNTRVINRPEAEAVVGKIVELCHDERYANKTMGVIVLQGEAQAGIIESALLEKIGADEMTQRRLVCGNPYSFQGDERDVIFLSMVAASNERIGPLTKTSDEQRFNVAASRARDQMWLFHSVTADELSASCLRRRLLEFFENKTQPMIAGISKEELEIRAHQDNRKIVKPPNPFDSWFEVDVALEIIQKGYVVSPQFEVAGKRIDLVIEGGQARLAIECDGDHWHGVDSYEEDMRRQRQLERCKWEFFRVRESAFYSDKELALKPLWPLLEEREIFPEMRSRTKPRVESPLSDSQETDDDDVEFQEENDIDDDNDDDDDELTSNVGGNPPTRDQNNNGIGSSEIYQTIKKALNKCPNLTCTEKSITARVLKELGIRTRGHPRRVFERSVMHVLNQMEKDQIVERYKSKNKRIRLLI